MLDLRRTGILAPATRQPATTAVQTPLMGSWWYCLRHNRVEDQSGCALTDRLGPYDSPEEAAQALDKARRRTEEEDARDRADDEWGEPPARW